MTDDPVPDLTPEAFADYCRTNAGLLSGRVETMGEAAADLLADLEAGAEDARERLERGRDRLDDLAAGEGDAGTVEDAIADAEERQADLATTRAELEAKQARMRAFEELAAGYLDLAAGIEADDPGGSEALERVCEFEADRDAPAYFEDRLTVLEAALRE